MAELLQTILGSLTDIIVYTAIGVVALIGLAKCVLPARRSARQLRRAVRTLETMPAGDARPVWQDVLFLGKNMQTAWRRFLFNAEQLDARGVNCDVEDYINDDTAIYASSHPQIADIVPGLLTSLGILGTFIGLMRGLGGLDVSGAEETMASISKMIGGMTFAFATSIAGVACSLTFNIIYRASMGGAEKALDEFHEAFKELVMQSPLDENAQAVCQREDSAAYLRHMASDMGMQIHDGVENAVDTAFTPVSRSMNDFILAQTQTQLEGVSRIVGQFVSQMNGALDGQFLKLGQTLTLVNQSQSQSCDSLNQAMGAADNIIGNLENLNHVTMSVMDRMDRYIADISQSQTNTEGYTQQSAQVLAGMGEAARDQTECLQSLKTMQEDMRRAMQEYADWSGRVLDAVKEQSDDTLSSARSVGEEMQKSGEKLTENYTAFVENIYGGLSHTVGMFESNMHSVLDALTERLKEIEQAVGRAPEKVNEQTGRLNQEVEGVITALSRLQKAAADIASSVKKEEKNMKLAEGA